MYIQKLMTRLWGAVLLMLLVEGINASDKQPAPKAAEAKEITGAGVFSTPKNPVTQKYIEHQ